MKIRARNRRGTLRTDFGARSAAPRGWVTVHDSGVMWFDEVASFTKADWDRLNEYIKSRPDLMAHVTAP